MVAIRFKFEKSIWPLPNFEENAQTHQDKTQKSRNLAKHTLNTHLERF